MRGTRFIWDANRVEYFRWLRAVMTITQLAEHFGVTTTRVKQVVKKYLIDGEPPQPKAHGMAGTRTYATWGAIVQRCTNANDHAYKDYGGRGVKVCDRWQKFDNFYADMGERPSNNHSIDRINVNGDYEPSNCRWATTSEQQRNKRTNVKVTWRGETWVLADLCRHLGIYSTHVYRVMARGNTLNAAIQHLATLKEKCNAKIIIS